MRSVRILTAGLLLLVCPVALAWQSTPPQTAPSPQAPQAPQAPMFRGGVELVTLDVRVVNKNGDPVTGLTPEEFVVSLDGRPYPVRALDYLTFGEPKAAAGLATTAERRAPAPKPAATTSASASRGGRVILLMVDDAAMRPLEGKELTTSAERMLATLDPADLVGITTTSGLGPAIAPTRDRAAIHAALESREVVGRADVRQAQSAFVTVDEAIEITRDLDKNVFAAVVRRECGGGPTGGPRGGAVQSNGKCISAIRQTSRQVTDTADRTTGQELAAIAHAIDLIQQAPKPRVLVFLTTGVALSPYEPSPLDVLSRAAAQADVSFYALVVTDETGLDLSDKGDSFTPGVPTRAEARRKEGNFLFDGTASTAIAAGGEAFHVIGQGDRFFTRILDETSATYRLGVEMPLGVDPAHAMVVHVTVNRPGVTTRANTHALPPLPPKPMSTPEAMKLRLEQGGATFGVPMTLATTVRRDAGARMQVLLNLDIPAAAPGPLTAMVALVNAAGSIVQSGQKTVPVAPNDDYHLAVPLAVDEGDYHLRLVLADAHGNIGSLDEPVVARPRVVGPFTASDLLLSTAGADGIGRLLALDTLPPNAAALQAEMDVYTPSPVDDVTVELSVTPADGGSAELDDVLTPVVRDGHLSIATRIPVVTLPPGTYVVRATVVQAGTALGAVSATLKKVNR